MAGHTCGGVTRVHTTHFEVGGALPDPGMFAVSQHAATFVDGECEGDCSGAIVSPVLEYLTITFSIADEGWCVITEIIQ